MLAEICSRKRQAPCSNFFETSGVLQNSKVYVTAGMFEEHGPKSTYTRTKVEQKASCLFWLITSPKTKAQTNKGEKLNINLNWGKTNAGYGKTLLINLNMTRT